MSGSALSLPAQELIRYSILCLSPAVLLPLLSQCCWYGKYYSAYDHGIIAGGDDCHYPFTVMPWIIRYGDISITPDVS